MAIQIVRRHRAQQGFSLVEFMLAAMFGLVALAVVGSVFVSGQKLATQRSHELLVLQSVGDALRYIKEDTLRAGYNGVSGESVKLSGAVGVIETASNSLSYVYKTPDNKYEHVTFFLEDDKLKTCSKSQSVISSIADVCNAKYSMLDELQVKVLSFEVTKFSLAGTKSSLITITLTAAMNDGKYQKAVTTTIKQRNWL
ncbi:pilus assembly protein PilW [Vibrio vulnificus]|nr:pilus assembly protein PilW [Vibrio vulnificus]